MAFNFMYVIALYFGTIWVLGNANTRVHSCILFAFTTLSLWFAPEESKNVGQYIYNVNIAMLWDGLTALFLTIFLAFDKKAWKQALLLSFAVFCHTMIVHDLNGYQTPVSLFFYTFYEELIVLVGLSQMAISYDGIIDALSNGKNLLRRGIFYSRRGNKSSFTP